MVAVFDESYEASLLRVSSLVNKIRGIGMSSDLWLILCIFVIGLVSLIGFFVTKTKGYGRYATSTFLILIVVVVASLMYSSGKLEGHVMANLLFAVVGFAGGLFTGKEQECTPKQGSTNNQANKEISG